MKKIIIFITLFFALALISVGYVLRTPSIPSVPNPTPTSTPITAMPTENPLGFCTSSDLESTIVLDAAAGNIFGTISIKNISQNNCKIEGDNFIKPTFTAKSITVSTQGSAGPQSIILTPNQTVYSQVHFPNGPQCQSGISQINISFSYQVSSTDSVIFKNQNGSTQQAMVVCSLSTDLTDVQVWSIWAKPLNQ